MSLTSLRSGVRSTRAHRVKEVDCSGSGNVRPALCLGPNDQNRGAAPGTEFRISGKGPAAVPAELAQRRGG